jgi:L-threonylcarbamoyladenylate synthase
MVEIGKDIEKATKLLRAGQLVAIPTETVYGLAANALDSDAVLKVFAAKNRPFFDPLIIHVANQKTALLYANFHDSRLLLLTEKFWPGPLTLLLPKKNIIPDIVTSGLGQVAVRVPNHPVALKLLELTQLPLAAPSANPFGYVSPTHALHVKNQLGDRIDYILDGGPCSVGLESTIVGIEDNQVCIYRLGGLAIEAIEKLVGKVELRINNSGDPKAPGQLKSHYAPKTQMIIGDLHDLIQTHQSKKLAVICFGNKNFDLENTQVFNLSKNENLEEAAINLFRYLRESDESGADLIIAEFVPDHGLGRAINDRLRRAYGSRS